MKVYLYSGAMDKIKKSGVGRAIFHQQNALSKNGVEVVDNINDADVVHINTIFPKSFELAKELRKKGVPVVYHAHSTKEDFRNSYIGANAVSGIFKKWISKCYSLGDVIVTPSDYSKSLLRGYGIKNRIFVISNGIDLGDYIRSEEAGKKFRRKFGFSDDDKIIVSVGLLMKRKGVDDFVELARRLPQYKFVWFGDADMRFVGKEIRNAVKTAPKNCIFAGYVKKPTLQAALSGSNLFLFPSREETEGIVVLEALAMKTPVLLRDIPVYGNWLKNGVNGYAAKDIDEFEELTVKILEGELPDLTEEGYKSVSEKSIEKVGAELIKAYEKAIEICSLRNGKNPEKNENQVQ